MGSGRRWRLLIVLAASALAGCPDDGGSTGEETDGGPDEVAADVVEVAPEATVGDTGDDGAPEVEVDEDVADTSEEETADTRPPADVDEVEVVVGGCGDGAVDPDEACDDGDLDDLDGCDRRCMTTRVVPPPGPGDVVVNELMINPSVLPDPRGEWIELASIATEELNLSGCALVDDGTDRVPLSLEGGATIAPGGLFLAAGDAGVAPDLVYATMLLDDVADEVVLECDGEVIDRVAYSAFGWPIIGGRALSLDPTRRDAEADDDVGAWCAATTQHQSGERGTPGAPNPACPHLDRSVDRCRLLGDETATGFADAGVPFDVEIEEAGLSDLTPGVDASPDLIVEVGSAAGSAASAGAAATDPTAFVWTRAVPLEGYEAPLGSRADVWRGQVVGASGQRRVMGRASRDGGASWRYCDRDGSDDGVSGDQLILLTVGPSPCEAVVCDDPPAASCAADGVHLDGFVTPGTCAPLGAGEHECRYPVEPRDCGALGRVCEAGGPDGAFCGAVPRTPVLGDLVMSELMVRPTASFGQWVELTSLADEPLLLTGCVLTLTTSVEELTWVLEAPTVIGPAAGDAPPPLDPLAPESGVIVLGRSDLLDDNGGAPVARAWGEALGEGDLPSSASLTLSCGEVLDVVAWDGTWPGVSGSAGSAMSLSPLRDEPSGNDAKESWCLASDSFGAGDRGTPGRRNPNCPGDILPVELCKVGMGQILRPPAGTSATTNIDVIARTWTARTLRTDVNAKLIVELGYAAAGASAAAIDTWYPGLPDTAWTASGAGVDPALDRYSATFPVPAPGTWDVYARATADGGNTWVTCDAVGLVDEGEVGDPAVLIPVPSACSPDPCGTVPDPYCREVAAGDPIEIVASSEPSTCTLVGNAAQCSYAETVTDDCSNYGAVCADGPGGAECVGFPRTPAPGEVVISELVIAAGNLELGEWIELQSLSDQAVDLAACGLRSRGPGPPNTPEARESWSFGEPPTPLSFVMSPREAVTVARSASSAVNGGAQPITVYSGISLDNESDSIELVCGPEGSQVVIDRVAWSQSQGWTIPFATSLQLSGARLDAASNDSFANFCAPGVTSPRVENGVCPGDGVLDDCRVGSSTGDIAADQSLGVSVTLSDPGVTDLGHGIEAAIGMIVEVGIGPASEPPMMSFAWHWEELDADGDWDDRDSGPAGWDRWIGEITPGAVGSLRLLGRVSLDGGATWTLCGTDGIAGGAADGRAITSRAGVCVPSPCTTPPAASCSGSTLTGYAPRGTCTSNQGAQCSYPSETFFCSSYGGCNAPAAGCNANPAQPSTRGEVVISEIMRDSTLPAPDAGEWIELHNASNAPVDLRGCELVDAAGARLTITRGVPDVVLAGARAVFARSDVATENGGVPTTYGKLRDLGGLALGNGSGSIMLACGGVEIDKVAWSYGWPGQRGVAMQLDRSHMDAGDNDQRMYWCDASPTYGNANNRGSPGALNPSCP